MRVAMVLISLILAQFGWGVCLGSPVPSVPAEGPLILIPTALQELKEYRINTGTKAVLNDGTLSAVYVNHFPAAGNTYLNFHVDAASEGGSFVLQTSGIRLESAAGRTDSGASVSYTPLDWFLDLGVEELRGGSLTVNDKALVQFTIEVPRAGRDDLVLFVRSQRIGTVREIRDRIARLGGIQ